MTRWRAAVALSAFAVLTASACGSPQREFRPAGAVAGQPSGTAPAMKPAGVETAAAGTGLQVSVDWPGGLDAAQVAMVKALTDTYTAQWRAVTSRGKDTAYLRGVEDPATKDAYKLVHSFVDHKLSATGVAKMYSLRVASAMGRGAEIHACVDESGVKVVDRSGTPVAKQPAWTKPPKSTFFQAAAIRQGADGKWRIKLFQHAVYPHERAKECVR
ncbi:hypothetical protein Pth03_16040 [Planotetraspora thailandica]|uniref:Lipoprotein n=1 Tax=Planotetraspora thailandica TaxID=487172 RepID=A0A8J3UYY6_9ACTN|nr:hypothetical protein [Planotetraspora thailandica]GII53215.1 hypothetical protein Pth03_16040 [Planotetraspora thailandica]